MNNATIFYNDARLLAGDANPFDVRYEAQALPAGSNVVGFLKRDEKGVQELLDKPFLRPQQEQNWIAVLEEARTSLLNN